jgi:glutamate-5-semialdehyde dehydrogenase
MGHTDGLCAIYLDETADREKAKHVVVDSKVSRHVALLESLPLSLFPSISSSHYHMSPLLQTDYLVTCNAVGTLLMH